MEQSPSWEANRFSASKRIPRSLCNPNIHYRIRKCPPPVPILSHIYPVHVLTPHFLNIHLNIILPSTSWSPQRSFSLMFPHQNHVYTSVLSHTCYVPRPPLSSRFDIRKILGEEYRTLGSSLCSFFNSPVTLPLLGPNILSVPYSQTPLAYVPPSMSGTKIHIHTKQQAKV